MKITSPLLSALAASSLAPAAQALVPKIFDRDQPACPGQHTVTARTTTTLAEQATSTKWVVAPNPKTVTVVIQKPAATQTITAAPSTATVTAYQTLRAPSTVVVPSTVTETVTQQNAVTVRTTTVTTTTTTVTEAAQPSCVPNNAPCDFRDPGACCSMACCARPEGGSPVCCSF